MKRQPVLYLKVNETDEELLEVVWANERLKWVIGTIYTQADIELFTTVDGVWPDTLQSLVDQIEANNGRLYLTLDTSVTPHKRTEKGMYE